MSDADIAEPRLNTLQTMYAALKAGDMAVLTCFTRIAHSKPLSTVGNNMAPLLYVRKHKNKLAPHWYLWNGAKRHEENLYFKDGLLVEEDPAYYADQYEAVKAGLDAGYSVSSADPAWWITPEQREIIKKQDHFFITGYLILFGVLIVGLLLWVIAHYV
jgi:hypothetical protein